MSSSPTKGAPSITASLRPRPAPTPSRSAGPRTPACSPTTGRAAGLRYRLDTDRLVYAPPWDAEAAARSPARAALTPDAELAVAQVVLAGDGETWKATPDLLAADRFSPVVKVEPSDEHGGYVLFGDGSAGRLPSAGADFTARIRLGGGRLGNVGRDAIGHIVTGDGSAVAALRNPIAAAGGRDPESVDRDPHRRAPRLPSPAPRRHSRRLCRGGAGT